MFFNLSDEGAVSASKGRGLARPTELQICERTGDWRDGWQ